MPVRTNDIFDDVVAKFSKNCNAFVTKFIEGQSTGSLPIAMGPTLRDFPGRWREKFVAIAGDNSAMPLIVEIGCHTGHTLCDMAQAHPDTLFVGVDITFKRVVQTAERARDRGLNNVFIVLANAGGLHDLFAANEVSGFVTFFPDPWKKIRHAHNRLYSAKFCATLFDQLSADGFVWLKTDHEPYFIEACALVEASGFRQISTLPVIGDRDYSSFFLRRFDLQGLPWYTRKWAKFNA
jgi:tRNA (guanine-N7-)-methyltransferase